MNFVCFPNYIRLVDDVKSLKSIFQDIIESTKKYKNTNDTFILFFILYDSLSKFIRIEQCYAYCAEMISIYVMHSILILFVIVGRP